MKIKDLLNSVYTVAVTNEENVFINRHPSKVKITSLNERDQILAQNLVRKGLYSISNDNLTLINQSNESNI